jgi:uncharacterized lipoprotein YddW (UPF0748 family)
MHRILILLLLLLSFSWSNSTEQLRGLWVIRYALSEQSNIDNIISTALQLKISDLYIQVRALGRNVYDGQHKTGKSIGINLKNLISKAKDSGLTVHAWINTMYVWSGRRRPSDPNHVLNNSEPAILRNVYDADIPDYKRLQSEGIEGFFVHPTDPYHLNEIKNTVSEIITRFDFDGIHFDYFRMPDIYNSFSPFGRTRYMLKELIDPVKIYIEPEKFVHERGFDSFLFSDSNYKNFLRQEFYEALKILGQHIHNFAEGITLSVAVKPDIIKARYRFFQDWEFWLKNDICDQVVLMNYTTDYEIFKRNITFAQHSGFSNRIIVGISTYNQNVSEVKRRILLINHLNFAGIALFSYNYLSKNHHYINNLSLINNKESDYGEDNSRTTGH